ncbi:MFS transporter [Gemmobacter serpentinus]|uniref:MFS transporter n=1 Tax=Gemmobacter serpentinus TaxID=2652247 RepID=UPI001CF715A2|nr:MFS transporter [Gemmobacter serpentinus]
MQNTSPTDAAAPTRDSAFSPLRYPDFRLIWTATLIANLGTLVQGVGAGWSMTELTAQHEMIALVQASTTLPIMLLAIPAGAIADLFNRRRVMLFSQGFMAVVSGLLAVASWQDVLGPWTLLAFTFLLGLGTALNIPSWQASVRDLVPREDLPKAVALNSMSFNLMRSVGPAIGGLLVAWAGPHAAFALNAISYLALIYALARWKGPEITSTLPTESLGSAITLGLRYVLLSPNLLTIILRGFLFGGGAVVMLALLPAISRDQMQAGAMTYGILLGAFGAGAIGGALLSAPLRRIWQIERVIATAFCGFALGTTVVALVPGPVLAVPGLILAGGAWVLALSLFNVSAQLASPRWVVGRVLAIYQTATFGGMAMGSWLWGSLSESLGIRAALLLAASTMLLGAGFGLIRRMPDFPEVDLDPANRFHAPALRLNLKARSGPLMVMIDWNIPPENTEGFLAAMAQRRQIRLRDGAREWALMRDLEDPDIWVEAYHVPTWTEYLRHQQRRTRSDAENFDKLLTLHRGPERPRVHRMIERRAVTDYHDIPILEVPKVP